MLFNGLVNSIGKYISKGLTGFDRAKKIMETLGME